ncbi:MAG: 16S rRNA (cytidine(1402)-2'-O)-methyltransferase [Abditibacteriales bacterium]|nr:16S rRNA (cytidine(1402)-2'-O)-methyltransferase [Abditibacteriales bacterium]
MKGVLFVCGTPIGNLEDVSLRLLRVLREVHLVAAEDTRITRKLLSHYDIHVPLASYHPHSSPQRTAELLRRLRAGENIALVSSAGMPGISDPGSALVRQALEEGIQVIGIPGPCAAVVALAISGFNGQRFSFLGFPPRKPGEQRRFLQSVAERPETLVFYESPYRVRTLLENAQAVFGDRRCAVVRELTKKFEETIVGPLSEVIAEIGKRKVLGEVTIVIEGSTSRPSQSV